MRALRWAAAVSLVALFATDGFGQEVKANFVAQGSFELPAKGAPGAPDNPVALALGPDGSVHIADSRGVVHIYGRDGGKDRIYGQPRLKRPIALAVDADGIAFVLDSDLDQVLVFGADGVSLRAIGRKGSKGGQLAEPVDLALGPSGHVYVLDKGRKGIEIFSYDGTFVRDIAFGETLREPMSLSVGNDGSIYVADKRTPTHVYSFPPFTEVPWSGQTPRGMAGRVDLRGAELDEPVATTVNDRGTVVVLDKKVGRLFRKNAWDKAEIGPNDLLYGGIGTGRGSFREAVDIAFDGPEDVLILDQQLRKVERIRLTTEAELRRRPDLGFPIRVTTVAPGLSEPLLDAGVDPEGQPRFLLDMEQRGASMVAARPEPYITVYGDPVRSYHPDPATLMRNLTQDVGDVGAAVLTDSTVVIADSKRNRFAIFELATGTLVGSFGDNYQDDRKLKSPRGVAVLDDGRIVIADTGNNRVKIFSSDLASLVASYPVNKPVGVAIAPSGEIFVWNQGGTVAGKLDPNEERLDPLPPPLVPGPIAALTFDEAGNLFLLDANTHRVTIIEEGLTRVLTQAGAEGAFDKPTRLNVDHEGNIYISDEGTSRTSVYRWDVHFPPLSGLDLDYEGAVAVLKWSPGPERYTRGYEIQGADLPDGPFHAVAMADSSPYRLDPENRPESPPRYVRVAPVFTTGVRGAATEVMPLSYFTAVAAYQAGNYEDALQEAVEGVRLIDEGILDASDDVKGKILRVGFASAYALGDYRGAVPWAQRAAAIPMPRDDLIEFLYMLADMYIKLGEPREASQQILTLVGQGPRPEYYQRTEVIQQSFVIYRQLRNAGYAEDALDWNSCGSTRSRYRMRRRNSSAICTRTRSPSSRRGTDWARGSSPGRARTTVRS
jgi:streptogramin lyase